MSDSNNLCPCSSLCSIENRAVLWIQGEDAVSFLDRVVTCNVSNLTNCQAGIGALLTPQGKINSDFLIIKDEDTLLLDTHVDHIDILAKQLRMLKMRARVEILRADRLAVFALLAKSMQKLPELPKSIVFEDPRFSSQYPLGNDKVFRIFLDQRDRRLIETGDLISNQSSSHFKSLRISAGIPEIGYDYASKAVFPTDVNLDIYGGIDYNKGCFIGQEVVSRMRRRSTIRKRTVKIVGESLETNAEIRSNTLVGTITSVSGNTGLACVRVDKLNDDDVYTANDRPVDIKLPGWLIQNLTKR